LCIPVAAVGESGPRTGQEPARELQPVEDCLMSRSIKVNVELLA